MGKASVVCAYGARARLAGRGLRPRDECAYGARFKFNHIVEDEKRGAVNEVLKTNFNFCGLAGTARLSQQRRMS